MQGKLHYLYRQVLPRLLQDKIDVIRGESQVFRPCFQDTKSIFIHIPKAAGTSIARAIYGMNVGHRKATDYTAVSKREFYKYYRFAFVRNPWDRAISAYTFVKNGGSSLVQPLENTLYQTHYFDTFDTFVTEWLPYQNLDQIDVVFNSQHPYIYDRKGKLLVNHIGKVENMRESIEHLEQKLGKPIKLEYLNSSNRKEAAYRDLYSEETASIIAGIYAKDIDLFGYKY